MNYVDNGWLTVDHEAKIYHVENTSHYLHLTHVYCSFCHAIISGTKPNDSQEVPRALNPFKINRSFIIPLLTRFIFMRLKYCF